jgi:hypothetical protein
MGFAAVEVAAVGGAFDVVAISGALSYCFFRCKAVANVLDILVQASSSS